jgi:hypothetical protein
MGHSCWHYFVPFQEDISAALEELRAAAFIHRAYVWEGSVEPSSMEELIEWAGESGTQSIIDMNGGVVDSPDFAAVAQLDARFYEELFGTVQPTHEQVQMMLDTGELHALCRSWEGVFIVVYEGDDPLEICFAGCSGD